MADEPIDFAHLAQYTAGDQALERDLLTEFVGNAEKYVAAIAAAPASESGQVAAHTLKGVAKGVGAFALADAAAEAENMVLLVDGGAGELLERLDGELARLRSAVAAMEH
jgi:HPt (histidine-containing phosphotransfer) domain-containing protein